MGRSVVPLYVCMHTHTHIYMYTYIYVHTHQNTRKKKLAVRREENPIEPHPLISLTQATVSDLTTEA